MIFEYLKSTVVKMGKTEVLIIINKDIIMVLGELGFKIRLLGYLFLLTHLTA